MRVKKVDHIAMLVEDMESLLGVFTGTFNLTISKEVDFPSDKIKVAFVDLGELQLEVIQPTGGGTPFARYLETKGPGLHHLALEVDDIRAALQAARDSGLKLQDEVPRRGAGGEIAYLDPESTGGVYIQFVQKAE
jgi:methylmalonyl-CoA epimerase